MDDLLIKNKNQFFNNNSFSNQLFNETFFNNKSQLIGIISELYGLKDIVSTEALYVVKFPPEVIQKLASGQFDIMKDNAGELMTTIVDVSKSGGKNIVHQLRMDKFSPSQLEKLGISLSNLAIHYQLGQILSRLEEIQETLDDIKLEMKLERFAKIYAGENQLEQAFLANEQPELIRKAIGILNEGRSSVEMILKKNISKIAQIPESNREKFWKIFLGINTHKKWQGLFKDIEMDMNAFCYATKLLIIAYSQLNEKAPIAKVLSPLQEFINNNHISVKQLANVAVYGEINSDSWYANPVNFINKLDNLSCMCRNEKTINEPISIEFYGKEIIGG